MKYRTDNGDVLAQREVSNLTLMEVLLQDAFLTNYKIMLGIVEEIVPNDDNKQIFVKCRPAIQRQMGVSKEGKPFFEDHSATYARLIQWGNNTQSITTPVIVNQLCLLLFADRPFDNAWTQEADSETNLITTQPLNTYRAHDMGDAFCIPIANDAPLTDITTIDDDVYISGNLTVNGNLRVNGNLTAATIEADNGYTGTIVGENGTFNFKGGICIASS